MARPSKRPLLILAVVALCVIVTVGVVTWKVTKDTYQEDEHSEEMISGTGTTASTSESKPITTQRPYTQEEIEAQPWLSLRMLRHVLPLHYDITIFPDFYDDGELFHGNETIELNVNSESKYILIHVHTTYMNVTSVQVVDNVTKSELAVKQTFVYKPHEFFVIEMAEPITAPVLVMLAFQGSMVKSIVGLYKGTYLNTATNQTRHLAASKFEPTFARQAYPCFDEPDIKAEYSISLVHKPGYTALSNMPQDGQAVAAPGRPNHLVTKFQRSVKMSTYLVTFVVGEFSSLNSTSKRGIPVRAFATPDKVQQVKFALEMATHTLDLYENLFNMTYPLPKQDLIAIPEFVSGAMEHWGLIAFRESRMLYDPTSASLKDAEDVAHVVAHEMAHMWFGNIVTMSWWNDLWLNEGFASYMEYIGADTKHPTWGLMEKFLTSDLFYVMPEDSSLSSHPIIVEVNDPAQITSVFDLISYSKGSSVIRMLEGIMGEAKFFEGVAIYLKNHKWGNARTDDLWQSLSEADSSYDVKHIMDTWTKQDGYPYINITITTAGNGISTIKAVQSRFLTNPKVTADPSASPFHYKWYVPLDFKTSNGQNSTKVMDMVDVEFTGTYGLDGNSKWIKFNINQNGFYRVLYPIEMWKTLSNYLQTTDYSKWKLSVEDRAGLINDALTFASAGMTPYSVPLTMMSYLAEERHVVPWNSLLRGGVAYIRRMLRDEPEFGLWKNFIASQTRPVLQRLGFTDSGTHMDKQVRQLVMDVALSVDEPIAVANVNQMFRNWLDNGQGVSVNLRSTVYKYGMMNAGTEQDFDKIWNKYLVESSPQEKNLLLRTLCYSRQSNLINLVLTKAMEGVDIRTQDFFTVIYQIGENGPARGIVWDWVRSNYQTLIDRFTVNDRGFGRMVYYMTRYYTTSFKLKQVENLFNEYPEEGASARYRKMAREAIETNIDWMANVKPQIITWLQNNSRG